MVSNRNSSAPVMDLLISLPEHLFPNLTVELYFLTQLLTSVGEDITDSTDVSPGKSRVSKLYVDTINTNRHH